jgi:hypothetical protein
MAGLSEPRSCLDATRGLPPLTGSPRERCLIGFAQGLETRRIRLLVDSFEPARIGTPDAGYVCRIVHAERDQEVVGFRHFSTIHHR